MFAEHGQAVRAYALRRLDLSTADDIVSDVFVIAFRRLDDIPDDALPWLLATARRVLANHRRSAGRRAALTAQLGVLHEGRQRDEVSGEPQLLRLATLSEHDREVLRLVA
jgi:RNA polymerase sigma-70 factor (ECF subfamily)